MLGKPLKEFAHVGNSFIRNLVYCFKNKNNQKNSQIRELSIIFAAFFTQAIPGMLQITIIDKDLEELITTGHNSGKYEKLARDKKFVQRLAAVYSTMESVETTDGLKQYSFLHYEKLKYMNLSSVRIMNNRVERLLFTENENKIEITIIELNETHYGNKK